MGRRHRGLPDTILGALAYRSNLLVGDCAVPSFNGRISSAKAVEGGHTGREREVAGVALPGLEAAELFLVAADAVHFEQHPLRSPSS